VFFCLLSAIQKIKSVCPKGNFIVPKAQYYSLFISEATSIFIIHLKIRSAVMNNE